MIVSLAAGALERLVQRLDVGIQIALGLEDVALNRHGLAMLAQVESRIDDVVMPAPCAGQNRRVAGPRDAREVDDRAVREHRAALDEAGEIRNRAAVVVELMAQFRMRQAVEQDHVHALRPLGIVVDYFVKRLAVLALQINFGAAIPTLSRPAIFGSPAMRAMVGATSTWRAFSLKSPAADARTAEHQRRAALHDVERAMLARLDSVGVTLGADDQVGRARTVEQLRDSLVGVRMAEHVGLEERAIGIVGAIAAASGGVEFLIDSGDDERILICDWVLADLLDDLERQRAAVVGEALESDHPAPRPYFVRVGPPRDREIDEIGGGRLGEQRENGRVAGIILMRIESLAAAAFRSDVRADLSDS